MGGAQQWVALAVAGFACVGPSVLALWSAACEIRARPTPGPPSGVQRQALAQALAGVEALTARIAETTTQGERAGLVRGEDGLFRRDTEAARTLNARLEQLWDRRRAAERASESLGGGQAGSAASAAARADRLGARAGLVGYCVVFAAASLMLDPDAVSPSALLFGTGLDAGARAMLSAMASAAGGLALLAVRWAALRAAPV
jgi:hypothetical protein